LSPLGSTGLGREALQPLPSAVTAMSKQLASVVGSIGQSGCGDDEPATPSAPTLLSAADVAAPQLERGTSAQWLAALSKLRGEELNLLALRHGLRPASKPATLAALSADAVRLAVPSAETPLPWPLTADALAPISRDQLSAWCRRAGLTAHGKKFALIERLCAAAGADAPQRPPPTAEELCELREQRTWRTPLFGVLGVRQLPLTYRFSVRPPATPAAILLRDRVRSARRRQRCCVCARCLRLRLPRHASVPTGERPLFRVP
jgi:hypothetical protein